MKNNLDKKYIENSRRIVSYYVGGNQSAEKSMLFLNGLYVGNESWIKQQRHQYFNKNYKLIFLDYPGVGSSIEKEEKSFGFDDIADEIKNILETESCPKSHIIGYSVGGMIGIWFAHCFQQYVESLVLLNSGVNINIYMYKMIHALIYMLDEEVSMEKVFMFLYPWNHSPEYLEKASEMQDQTLKSYAEYNKNKTAFKLLLESVWKRPNLEAVLKDIMIPTLIISGDKDMVFPIEYQEELAGKITNSRHVTVNGSGHASFIEKYQDINALMEEHLKNIGRGDLGGI